VVKASGWVTITLAVHPRCGEKVNVVSLFGSEAVDVETADGRRRLMPVRWTSLSPPGTSKLGGEPVRFALEPLKALASWVASRTGGSSANRQKFDHFDKQEDNVVPDGEARKGTTGDAAQRRGRAGGANDSRERRAAAAVVEQAGPPRTRSRGRRGGKERKRGSR